MTSHEVSSADNPICPSRCASFAQCGKLDILAALSNSSDRLGEMTLPGNDILIRELNGDDNIIKVESVVSQHLDEALLASCGLYRKLSAEQSDTA